VVTVLGTAVQEITTGFVGSLLVGGIEITVDTETDETEILDTETVATKTLIVDKAPTADDGTLDGTLYVAIITTEVTDGR